MRIAEKEKQLFIDYEKGDFDDRQFRQQLREVLQLALSDDQINTAWNAMLLDIPKERIELLQALRKQYNLYVLSNTNAIHLQTINTMLHQNTSISSLDELFDKTYYSYQIKKSKPSAASFQHVLQDSNSLPEETLFIDDSLINIDAAKQLGIHTVHIQPPATILDIFTNARK
jgi:glucose-1-phosphatase